MIGNSIQVNKNWNRFFSREDFWTVKFTSIFASKEVLLRTKLHPKKAFEKAYSGLDSKYAQLNSNQEFYNSHWIIDGLPVSKFVPDTSSSWNIMFALSIANNWNVAMTNLLRSKDPNISIRSPPMKSALLNGSIDTLKLAVAQGLLGPQDLQMEALKYLKSTGSRDVLLWLKESGHPIDFDYNLPFGDKEVGSDRIWMTQSSRWSFV